MSKKVVLMAILMIMFLSAGVYLFTRSGATVDDSVLGMVNSDEVELLPESYDLGTMVMKDGFVYREYEIKNNSKNTLRVKNIVTSCMCTKAQVVFNDRRTRFYGMEMSGAKNPNINFDIPGESVAKLLVRFDPAAHGPQGVGPVDRYVTLNFQDPVGSRTVGFVGEVVLKK